MVKATVRKPTVTPQVTVAPSTQTASPAPQQQPVKPTATAAAPAIIVEAQVVEVEGVKVECQNTAAVPTQEADLASIVPDTTTASTQVGQEQPAPATETASTPEVPATRPAMSVPAVYSGSDESGFDSSDDKYPVLRIVAGSGKLSTMFNVGSVILGLTIDEADQLAAPPDPKVKSGAVLKFIPLALRKSWRENLTEDETKEGLQPRYFQSRQEVEEAGGTTAWIDNQPPTFKPTATCLLLLQQPEGCESSLFTTELDGKLWCPASYYASNSAFKKFALPIHNARRTLLQVPVLDDAGQPQKDTRGFVLKREYLPRYTWTFRVNQTLVKRVGDNREFTVFVPEVRVLTKEESGPEFRAFAESLVPTAPADAGE